MFEDPLLIVVILTVFAVLVILMVGLGGFAGGGAFNKRNANKVMRLRLGAQLLAVILIVVLVWLRKDTG
ncbi:MAG: twin transmembrane helix small protein [Pseudomonadota bacterium]